MEVADPEIDKEKRASEREGGGEREREEEAIFQRINRGRNGKCLLFLRTLHGKSPWNRINEQSIYSTYLRMLVAYVFTPLFNKCSSTICRWDIFTRIFRMQDDLWLKIETFFKATLQWSILITEAVTIYFIEFNIIPFNNAYILTILYNYICTAIKYRVISRMIIFSWNRHLLLRREISRKMCIRNIFKLQRMWWNMNNFER